jgi:uncharacterized protein (DUF924 family)
MPEAKGFEVVHRFWFGELDASGRATPEVAKRWFGGPSEFDAAIRDRFLNLHGEIAAGGHRDWLESPRGRLSLVIVLDQFSRNMFRGTAQMFAYDGRALELALDGIGQGEDRLLRCDERAFLYMPLMHSEKLAVQERCVDLFATLADEQSGDSDGRAANSLKFAERHRDIIRRFARFPHRNAILGRSSRPEELEFLRQPGSSF